MDKNLIYGQLIFNDEKATKSIMSLLRENGYELFDYTFGNVFDYCTHRNDDCVCNENCDGCVLAQFVTTLRG